MEPIYNQDSQTVRWLKEEVIYDIHGTTPIARGDEIFNYYGYYPRRLDRDFFSDKERYAIAFLYGAM